VGHGGALAGHGGAMYAGDPPSSAAGTTPVGEEVALEGGECTIAELPLASLAAGSGDGAATGAAPRSSAAGSCSAMGLGYSELADLALGVASSAWP
jgi:hypothetical protein